MDLDRTCRIFRFTGDPTIPGDATFSDADEKNIAGLEEQARQSDQFAADVRGGKFPTLTDARRAMNRLRNVPNTGQLTLLPAAYTPKAKGEVGF
jgi:hypothetical protein